MLHSILGAKTKTSGLAAFLIFASVARACGMKPESNTTATPIVLYVALGYSQLREVQGHLSPQRYKECKPQIPLVNVSTVVHKSTIVAAPLLHT